ncbi:hypothetical protein H0H87_005639 [Tephrocybe sp. NHM501043]|nr:hypothetical protein H0H87_005639 [Tephrocybe sp. NHM501043]
MENPHAERQAILLERILKNTEILRANAYIKTAADLATKYRKNVQYNLEATRENRPSDPQ